MEKWTNRKDTELEVERKTRRRKRATTKKMRRFRLCKDGESDKK